MSNEFHLQVHEKLVSVMAVEEPYDEHEIRLIREIRLIQEDHHRTLKPYLDALTAIRACKPQRLFLLDLSRAPSAQPCQPETRRFVCAGADDPIA
jgi:hypothetical protein